jgi:hypothetical protein
MAVSKRMTGERQRAGKALTAPRAAKALRDRADY